MKNIAINGFGRIGRQAFKQLIQDQDIKVVGINDLTEPKTLAYLLKYDSAHGTFNGEVSFTDDTIIVNGQSIPIFAQKDPAELPWKKLGVDLVIESTGRFTDLEGSSKHITAGAKKVAISAPAGEGIKTVVYEVNEQILDHTDKVISVASCTTNCLAPVAKVLNDQFGIVKGFMTTVHAYTADQRLVDSPHNNLRRARAAAANIVPTSTGAASAIGKVIPALQGRLDGIAMRVPVLSGSVIDLVVELKKPTSVKAINAAMQAQSSQSFAYNEDQIVSSDVIGSTFGSIFDATLTSVMEIDGKQLVKVVAWYDNESSYVSQYIRTIKHFINL